MAKVLKGIEAVNSMKIKMIDDVNNLRSKGVDPCLAIVRIGKREDNLSYERGAVRRCEGVGLTCKVFEFDENIDEESFLNEFGAINKNKAIHGILLFRPFPKQISEKKVIDIMDTGKDIDCMTPVNLTKVFTGDETGYAPCTAEAVIKVLEHFEIDVTGKNVVVVGRSLVVGKPLSMMLLKKNATITICHTKTKNIQEMCKRADIVIAAAGNAKMITAEFISEGTVVIDVGINVDENGNLWGDIDFDSVSGIASDITPVPGGVGTVTTSVLAEHVIRAASTK
jgi:methylenetetrahydrofolate dehydrogenase (NADP+) / methenyltetrahydrofolate cyclohydrolase